VISEVLAEANALAEAQEEADEEDAALEINGAADCKDREDGNKWTSMKRWWPRVQH